MSSRLPDVFASSAYVSRYPPPNRAIMCSEVLIALDRGPRRDCQISLAEAIDPELLQSVV